MLLNITAVWPKINIAIDAETGMPQLGWQAVEGAKTYKIYRASSRNGSYRHIWTVSGTRYLNTNALPGRTYYYKVQPVGVEADCSEVAYITCDCAQPHVSIKPDAASGLPVLSWDEVAGAAQYEVYRADRADGSYIKMLTTPNTGYTNITAKAGYTYYYKVKALCGSSRYGDSALSETVFVTCDCAAPVVTATVKEDSAVLSWRAVTGAGKYEIYRAANENGTFMRIATVDKPTYTISTLVPGTTWYKVKALCARTSFGDGELGAAVGVTAE